jgi:hypothetical protein
MSSGFASPGAAGVSSARKRAANGVACAADSAVAGLQHIRRRLPDIVFAHQCAQLSRRSIVDAIEFQALDFAVSRAVILRRSACLSRIGGD